MIAIVQTWRDFREFLEAKKRKREPLRLRASGGSAASYRPSSARGFENFRAALRRVPDWGQASERIDALESALLARHAIPLPLPRKVLQNEDRSLSLYWGEQAITVRCFVDGMTSMIGGTKGMVAKKITRELLDALAFHARIQQAS